MRLRGRALLLLLFTAFSSVQLLRSAALGNLPPRDVLARSLINELDQIEQPFILVLDDYFMLETQTILDLIKEMLLHPPRNLHLVLGTRIDPSLPLVTLRANRSTMTMR